MTDERELRRLLYDAAPVSRITARCCTVHHDAGNRQLAFSAFAARLEIDRRRKAVGLLVELLAGRELVDQRLESPAAFVEPGRLGRDPGRLTDR